MRIPIWNLGRGGRTRERGRDLMGVQLASLGALPKAPKCPWRTDQVCRYYSKRVNILLTEALGLYEAKRIVRKYSPLSQFVGMLLGAPRAQRLRGFS